MLLPSVRQRCRFQGSASPLEKDGVSWSEAEVKKPVEMMTTINSLAAGKSFLFKDLVEYEKDKAVKAPVLSTDGTSIVVVAMDHANLPEHTAPKNAIFTVLEGEGTLVYEKETVKLHHGMSIKFDQGALHSVSTDKKMKFMLLFY